MPKRIDERQLDARDLCTRRIQTASIKSFEIVDLLRAASMYANAAGDTDLSNDLHESMQHMYALQDHIDSAFRYAEQRARQAKRISK